MNLSTERLNAMEIGIFDADQNELLGRIVIWEPTIDPADKGLTTYKYVDEGNRKPVAGVPDTNSKQLMFTGIAKHYNATFYGDNITSSQIIDNSINVTAGRDINNSTITRK